MHHHFVVLNRGSGKRHFRVARWPHFMPHHAAGLVQWAQEHGRFFPWRDTESPYAKLVGEMLLRKTSTRHAQKAYAHLVERFANPHELLMAEPAELHRILQPLGMVSHRIEALQGMARFLVQEHGGQVPPSPTQLMKIPHVGRYTANAVCSFAFGMPLPIVDTNVVRVLHRFTGIHTSSSRPYTKDEIWQRMARSLPESHVDMFNYGLLDLGATVCRPAPLCKQCPLRGGCVFAKNMNESARTTNPPKPHKKAFHHS